MSTNTQIEWADKTWSPVVGCTQISPGCAHCYALVAHNRRHKAYLAGKMQSMPQYAKPFSVVQTIEDRLDAPLSWRKPQHVFVNSQSDLFHEDIGESFIASVFAVMALADRHTFKVLTKRPKRMRAMLNDDTFRDLILDEVQQFWDRSRWVRDRDARYEPESIESYGDFCSWLDRENWPLRNLWLGVSVENQRWADERIPLLLQTPAAVRFLSCEPLLGPVDVTPYVTTFDGVLCCPKCGFRTNRFSRCPNDNATLGPDVSIDWVITGMESGKGARPAEHAWVRSLRDQVVGAGKKFMWKQDATPNGRKISLPVLDGRQWTEMPELAHA
jgi:protein gp37